MTEGISVATAALCKLISGKVPASKADAAAILRAYCGPDPVAEEEPEEKEPEEKEEVQDSEGLPTQA